MTVFFTASRNLYPYLYPPIYSLLETNPDVEKIYILCEDDELNVSWDVPEQVECINVSGERVFLQDSPNIRTAFSRVTLMRACIADLVPESVKRIIQLDADVIITDSLQPLWDLDMTGKWIAACKENEKSTQKAFQDLDERYFNVGVAVLNLEQIRKDGITQRIVNYLNTVYMPWIDQDAWNNFGLKEGKILEIENVRYNESFVTGYTEDPAIVHFCGIGCWWLPKQYYRREYWDKYYPPR